MAKPSSLFAHALWVMSENPVVLVKDYVSDFKPGGGVGMPMQALKCSGYSIQLGCEPNLQTKTARSTKVLLT